MDRKVNTITVSGKRGRELKRAHRKVSAVISAAESEAQVPAGGLPSQRHSSAGAVQASAVAQLPHPQKVSRRLAAPPEAAKGANKDRQLAGKVFQGVAAEASVEIVKLPILPAAFGTFIGRGGNKVAMLRKRCGPCKVFTERNSSDEVKVSGRGAALSKAVGLVKEAIATAEKEAATRDRQRSDKQPGLVGPIKAHSRSAAAAPSPPKQPVQSAATVKSQQSSEPVVKGVDRRIPAQVSVGPGDSDSYSYESSEEEQKEMVQEAPVAHDGEDDGEKQESSSSHSPQRRTSSRSTRRRPSPSKRSRSKSSSRGPLRRKTRK